MTTLLNGVIGGLVVGLIAAVTTQFFGGDPSATAPVVERLGRSRFAASRWSRLAVMSLYGGLAGSGFLAVELFVLRVLSIPPTIGEALGATLLWSAVLSLTWILVEWAAPSLSRSRSRLGKLLAYHSVYGVGLGLWIRFTWIT